MQFSVIFIIRWSNLRNIWKNARKYLWNGSFIKILQLIDPASKSKIWKWLSSIFLCIFTQFWNRRILFVFSLLNFQKKTAKKPGNKYICFILLYLSLLSLFYSVFFLVYCPVYRVIPTKDETVKTTKTFLYTTIISKKQILCLALNMALNSLFIDLAY